MKRKLLIGTVLLVACLAGADWKYNDRHAVAGVTDATGEVHWTNNTRRGARITGFYGTFSGAATGTMTVDITQGATTHTSTLTYTLVAATDIFITSEDFDGIVLNPGDTMTFNLAPLTDALTFAGTITTEVAEH